MPMWKDVTREVTSEAIGGGSGWDWVGGSDFQRSPGCCISIGKLFRDERDELLLYVRQFIGAPGDEHDLTQAIVSAGYYPGTTDFEGRAVAGRSLLIVGDGTGAIQDASHRRGNPYSFTALINDGWKVVPPMKHYKSGSPCNPEVLDSRKQMNSLLAAGRIVLDPACAEPAADFPSLVDGFKRTKLMSSGKFEKRGHFTHGPDGVRYLAWKFMPRPKPAPIVYKGPDMAIFEAVSRIRWSSHGL
jgi:hypothetical protein